MITQLEGVLRETATDASDRSASGGSGQPRPAWPGNAMRPAWPGNAMNGVVAPPPRRWQRPCRGVAAGVH